ncbi:MAG: ABC transporter substrate-binding protein [Anaerolineae bacterium]|nr:ABC transporter substrate-binding protein [Thermoflexus sp.]MDW8064779.1 ABC transporter substrate-binding protein [Anaerolineae bacterium]
MKRIFAILSLGIALALFLGACRPATRAGARPDEIVVLALENDEQGIARLLSRDIDIFAHGVGGPERFRRIQADPELTYSAAFGVSYELTFNPVLNFQDGRLNPFGDPQIREAMNWAVDRNFIVQEIFGGLATSKILPVVSAFPDYIRYLDTIRPLETKYAYNLDRAREVISKRLTELGAQQGADGKWTYKGQPITLIFIIRNDDERIQIGDYVATQLEKLGFTVDRQYKNRIEAAPIWIQSDPAEGKWHLYTGGWLTTAVERDSGLNFAFYYTKLGQPARLWQAYTPTPEFFEIAQKLANNQFSTMEERGQLFTRAMELALQDSVRVWLVDAQKFTPHLSRLEVAADLAGGVEGTPLWPFTLRFKDQAGGRVRWGQPDVLVQPWNPIAGSNWSSDTVIQRGLGEYAVIPDPYTGLNLPNRVERAQVVVQRGLPVIKTLDWVDLQFADRIEVPSDAWVDWDPVNQRFITAGEKFNQTVTARVKVTVYYPRDLFQKVRWHDGSPLTVGDFVMLMIMTFDPGKEGSPIFDEAIKPTVDNFLQHFKGVRIVSTDPLVIETYEDLFTLDAENLVATWWPYYAYGQLPWHALALGYLADSNKELAFSSNKAEQLKVEWMSFVSGPSLPILKKYLDQAQSQKFIPYEPTMGKYVTADEAASRYANLAKWYDQYKHFWVGTGPYILAQVDPTAKILTLRRYEGYPDPADKWARFAKPKIAAVEVEGPSQISRGQEAIFDVFITFEDQPYPAAELQEVKFLVFDPQGNLLTSGPAQFTAEGRYRVVLTGDITGRFPTGTVKLEVAAISKLVSVPALAARELAVVGP